MGFKCCVTDCKSGYASQSEKVTFFSFPEDLAMRKKWIRLIGLKKVIGKDWKVCENHFIKSYILPPFVDDHGCSRVNSSL